MPRAIRSAQLETRTSRLKLPIAKKPVFVVIAKGIALGYRRNHGAGTWVARASDGKGGTWTKAFAIADDHEDAGGEKVLTFWQAQERARKLARGQDADAGRPVTVDEALSEYGSDLKRRGGGAMNAKRVHNLLPASLLAKPVSLLVARDLTHWRDGLLAGGKKGTTINRTCNTFKAALNLAAKLDDRITNAKAWQIGLAAVSEADAREANVVLTGAQVRAVVAAAYDISAEFGLLVEAHAVTGARTSQIAELNCGDLQPGSAPKLMMPSSLKGRGRTQRTRKPVPIALGLAKRLQAAAAGRDAADPLLRSSDGGRWRHSNHCRLFAQAAKACGLPHGATIYALRHTAVTMALLAGVPVRLAASSFDTSIGQIEKTYRKFIADHGDTLMRRAVFDVDAPEGGNVIPLASR